MIIMKFGGSSVATAENIKQVLNIIQATEMPQVVVVSALGGCTDGLADLANESLNGDFETSIVKMRVRHQNVVNELINDEYKEELSNEVNLIFDRIKIICQGINLLQELSDNTLAKMMSFGEMLSSKIIAIAARQLVVDAEWADMGELIKTDSNPLNGKVIVDITKENIKTFFTDPAPLTIVPGFIASDGDGKRTTLGRGGSDYTASILAASLESKDLIIWSDVDGILTANPNIVKRAKTIPHLSYNEAFELSHFGAKVLYPPAIQPAYSKNIPIQLKNTFNPSDKGSIINRGGIPGQHTLTGISNLENLCLVTVSGTDMVGVAGFSARIFNRLNEGGINVVLIAQSCSEHGICVALKQNDGDKAQLILNQEFEEEIKNESIAEVEVENNLTGLAFVGDGMKRKTGVSGMLFQVLGENKINIKAIAQGSSESNISIIINNKDSKRALRILHERFFENKKSELHLFISGLGNVGQKLLEIIENQKDFIFEKYGVTIKVCGLINSRKMVISDLNELKDLHFSDLENSTTKADLEYFVNYIINSHLPNSILVDNTASEIPTQFYSKLMEGEVSVVACNKIGIAATMNEYEDLIDKETQRLAKIKYETTVGAAVPVISTIQALRESGDQILSVDAVLSGSLSFIFNQYNGEKTFRSIVEDAMKLGFTEPQPLIDLSGKDVLRKILIIARTCGESIEERDVKHTSFLPKECLESTNTKDFLNLLEKNENHFKALYDSAVKNKCKLKFVARYNKGKAEIGLFEVDENEVLGSLKGEDNIIIIKTRRYSKPLIIQGAGAGAELTASGVFSDILSLI